ncbi:hypothetical protein H6P81_007741 [Aristolochia fimbriata]|uniref:Uncharacterized protein n=1 Tax=Aristolochia fimbriata TaxID=158543 RepID=A0AAV7F190_ARIFI|nr:hypothetical protein H6P81_007741 [Aristolochia fimbriata]
MGDLFLVSRLLKGPVDFYEMIEVDEAWEQSLLQQGYVFTDEEEYGDDYGDDEDIIRCNKAWPIDSEEVDWWKENAPPVDRDLRYRTIFFGVYRMDLEAKEWIKHLTALEEFKLSSSLMDFRITHAIVLHIPPGD